MTDWHKVYSPHTGMYLGVIWRNEWGVWIAESRSVRTKAFTTEELAVAWLQRQIDMSKVMNLEVA